MPSMDIQPIKDNLKISNPESSLYGWMMNDRKSSTNIGLVQSAYRRTYSFFINGESKESYLLIEITYVRSQFQSLFI